MGGIYSNKSGPAYRHTPACKLQASALACLAAVCWASGVAGGDHARATAAALPYLAAGQPAGLQAAGRLAVLRVKSES